MFGFWLILSWYLIGFRQHCWQQLRFTPTVFGQIVSQTMGHKCDCIGNSLAAVTQFQKHTSPTEWYLTQHHSIKRHLRTRLNLALNRGASVSSERICLTLYESITESCLPAAAFMNGVQEGQKNPNSKWSLPWTRMVHVWPAYMSTLTSAVWRQNWWRDGTAQGTVGWAACLTLITSDWQI